MNVLNVVTASLSDNEYFNDNLPYLITGIILLIMMGIITRLICMKKGYDGGFGWGFLLGLIGLVIVLLWRPKEPDPVEDDRTEAEIQADELARFKGLLDSGAITQEEYEAKKKEILNL